MIDAGTTEFLINSQPSGYQSIEYSLPMKAETQFRMGSNSKLVCAVAIYQLQEQGRSSGWDDDDDDGDGDDDGDDGER